MLNCRAVDFNQNRWRQIGKNAAYLKRTFPCLSRRVSFPRQKALNRFGSLLNLSLKGTFRVRQGLLNRRLIKRSASIRTPHVAANNYVSLLPFVLGAIFLGRTNPDTVNHNVKHR